jgi:hypothetical protein
MSLTNTLLTGWHPVVLATSHPDTHQRLLEHVCDAYRAEVSTVAQFRQHAQRMYYPHLREELLRMAAETQAHISWLEEKSRALGGTLPQRSGTPTAVSQTVLPVRLPQDSNTLSKNFTDNAGHSRYIPGQREEKDRRRSQ